MNFQLFFSYCVFTQLKSFYSIWSQFKSSIQWNHFINKKQILCGNLEFKRTPWNVLSFHYLIIFYTCTIISYAPFFKDDRVVKENGLSRCATRIELLKIFFLFIIIWVVKRPLDISFSLYTLSSVNHCELAVRFWSAIPELN